MVKPMILEECAAEARNSPKTIWRWVKKGYKGKKLFATQIGHKWLVNPSTWATFKREVGLI